MELRNGVTVAVDDTATLVVEANSGRRGLILHLAADADPICFGGDDDVTFAGPFFVATQTPIILSGEACPLGDIYAICDDSGTADVLVQEIVI